MKFSPIEVAIGALVALSATLSAQNKPVFEEGFESGKLDPAVWDQRVTGAATAAVEAVEGAHGKYALHIHYPDMAAQSYAFVVATHLPDSVKTHFFGRAYVKIAPGLGATHNPLIFAGEPGWPLSKWEFNDDPASITIWIDGQRLGNRMNGEKVDMVKFAWPKGSATNSGLVGGFKEFGFGARVWGAPPEGFDIYYDDVAVGTERIGAVK
jgi:hypothetical protein